MSLVKRFEDLSQGWEVPPEFCRWAGITLIGACMGRQFRIRTGHITLWPNFYTLLVGPPSGGKSQAMNFTWETIQLLKNPPRIVSSETSPQALTTALAETGDQGGREKIQIGEAQGFALIDEFTTFFNKRTCELGMDQRLCNLYNCRDKETVRTQRRGVETLNKVWFGFLGGATPDGIRRQIGD